jgi:hypothetical protein
MVGFGPKVGGGSGSITIRAPAQLPLVAGNYDNFELSYDLNDNLIQVLCYRDAALILTIDLEYDINDNLIRVTEV